MLKPVRKEATRVADGRRFAARSIVITNLSSIECYVYRRNIVPINANEARQETIYAGAVVLSSQEEHATEYEDLGYAKLLFDHFSGGSLHNDMDDINSGDPIFYAQIEPFDLAYIESQRDMIRNVPDWQPKKGDIFALLISEDTIKWLECVGSQGQSIHSDYGNKYVLNLRDPLDHLEPFISQEDLLTPESKLYPLLMSDLIYNDAPIFDIYDNDPGTKDDDQITMRKFKFGNMNDPTFEREMAVLAIKNIQHRTKSAYFFDENDTKSITVSLKEPETFVLTADKAVKSIWVNGAYMTYGLIVIDHVGLVKAIDADLAANKPVLITHDNVKSFEILPSNFNAVHKFYTVVIMMNLNTVNHYELQLSSGEKHAFSIDLTQIQGV